MDFQLYFALIAAALSIHSMIDILMKSWPATTRLLWFAFVVLVPVLGPVTYYIKRKSMMDAKQEV